jgi:hypothetical protein
LPPPTITTSYRSPNFSSCTCIANHYDGKVPTEAAWDQRIERVLVGGPWTDSSDG